MMFRTEENVVIMWHGLQSKRFLLLTNLPFKFYNPAKTEQDKN